MTPSDPILILTTGGTIDKQYFDALSKYQITDTVVTKLLSIARVTHPYVIQEVLRKDSIDLTDEDRQMISTQDSLEVTQRTHPLDRLRRATGRVDGMDARSERPEQPPGGPADASEPDDADDRAPDGLRGRPSVEATLRHCRMVLRQAFGQRQGHRKHVLSHRVSVGARI